MTYITFAPDARDATYRFELDAEAPRSVLPGGTSLGWKVTVSEISSYPARMVSAQLKSGGLVRDLTGFVSISAGTATPDGQAIYDGSPRWGYLSYRTSPEERFIVGLHVSERLFERLLELAKAGTIPTVIIQLSGEKGIETSQPDGRLHEWDNVSTPHVEILWCEFEVALPRTNEPLSK